MTKHEADVIGGLNMTDQISNEAYKQIMIAAQDENEVGEVLDEIRAEIEQEYNRLSATRADETLELGECLGLKMSLKIIDKYKAEGSEE